MLSEWIEGWRNRVDVTAPPPGGWATSIERRSALSVEEFLSRYMIPRQPVIVTDAARHWEALRWTPDSLRARLGARLVPVGGSMLPFDEFIDRMRNDPATPYLNNVDIPKYFPDLMPDIRPELPYALPNRLFSHLLPPNYPTPKDEKLFVTLFIGGRGRTFRLHYDFFNVHTFITQLHGDKEFKFYSPDHGDLLYPDPVGGKISKVDDVWTPREDQFPLLKDARPIHLTMHPGETLFVPAGWWHSTRLGDSSISIGESCVNSSNWLHFVRDAAEMASHPMKVKGALVATFLLGAGALMEVGERLLRRQTGAPHA